MNKENITVYFLNILEMILIIIKKYYFKGIFIQVHLNNYKQYI